MTGLHTPIVAALIEEASAVHENSSRDALGASCVLCGLPTLCTHQGTHTQSSLTWQQIADKCETIISRQA